MTRFATCNGQKHERLTFGSKQVIIYSAIYGKQGIILVCTMAMVSENYGIDMNTSLCDTTKKVSAQLTC